MKSHREISSVLNRVNSEVRSAIHDIFGFLEIVQDGDLSERQRVQIIRSRIAGESLLRVLDNATDCIDPRIESIRPATSYALLERIEAVVDVYGALARAQGLQFHCRIEAGVPSVFTGSPADLETVLGHLLDNAIRFTSSGHVEALVGVTSTADDGFLRIAVRDTGPGIPADVLQQVGRGTVYVGGKAESGIAGFGLALSLKKLAHVGGRLELKNRRDSGAEAVMFLPLGSICREPDRAADPVTMVARDSQDRAARLLIAENNDDSYLVLEVFLRPLGHVLTRATNGLHAVNMVKETTFDMLLIDAHMPLLDGFAATREIRMWESSHARPRLPIIILSADRLEAQRRKGAAAGCSAYLQKPLVREPLISAIDVFLRQCSGDSLIGKP